MDFLLTQPPYRRGQAWVLLGRGMQYGPSYASRALGRVRVVGPREGARREAARPRL